MLSTDIEMDDRKMIAIIEGEEREKLREEEKYRENWI